MSFVKQLEDARVNILKSASKDSKKILTTLSDMIVDGTPVLTGRLKGNWIATIGSPAAAKRDNLDPVGSATKAEIYGIVDNLPNSTDWVFYLVNNQPYGQRIEYLGWSQKAPYGMVRISLTRLASSIRHSLKG